MLLLHESAELSFYRTQQWGSIIHLLLLGNQILLVRMSVSHETFKCRTQADFKAVNNGLLQITALS
jgi:hypothetical protein